MKYKENTNEIKFGISLEDEDGFVTNMFFTKDVWKKIIKSIEQHIQEDNRVVIGNGDRELIVLPNGEVILP